ncbi:MAG: hypothetical protein ABIL25_01515 [candidate division WOR-3 bacterium]
MYEQSQVTSASDFCISKLVEAIRAAREQEKELPVEFDDGALLLSWAQENGIAPEDQESFVKEARAMFETEVVVRGLVESVRFTEKKRSTKTVSSEDVAYRHPDSLFSPVYTLIERQRRK